MRLLLIGQAPSRETDGLPPFVGKSGMLLANLMGTSQEKMLADHDFINVLERWPGKGIGGDKFPIADAKKAAVLLFPKLRDRTTILLGANVARAFGASQFEYMRWYELRDPGDPRIVVCSRLCIMPHTSGVNRWWNSSESRDAARKFFGRLLQ